MNSKLAPLIEKIQSSFWFVPSLMMVCSLILAAGTIYLDTTHLQDKNSVVSFLYATDVNAVRSLLGTIAGAMITVTSIAFSITIVSLTLASSQFGPRLMRNFMMDKGTQFVLGSFIATFLFCITVFCAISFKEPYSFQPGITLAVAITMTCFSVWILIYFIHHVAQSIQADVVIDGVYCELEQTIAKLFPKISKEDLTREDALSAQENIGACQLEVSSPFSAYLQLIDKESLLNLADKSQCTIQLHYSAGDFIVENATIATVFAKGDVEPNISKDIIEHTVHGAYRTPVQDPEFAVHQLVEIALRALSPGINDPYTAITCIDKLSSVLCSLADKTFPQTNIFVNGVPRLVCKALTFTDIATAAFDQIRQESETNLAVTIKMLDSLHVLATQAKTAEHEHFVLTQAAMIEQQQAKQSLSDSDKVVLLSRIEKITRHTKII
tara:strand:+ start:3562 stop:4878 length:1317 start_codon:yes stop_codon:yes gene_type:complete